ncbi:hypothetical protein HPB48_012292 [Haemaphysalis longicornis]|uniref:Uncharacterized protein n=1 Tax=Haemaphysalis longicornis TaxID=44386 RepID=A0A9J6GMJ7_HAELO|nr:hypothetical protein HPB48_012292 [Haemaphysalis longicornis]
MTEERGEFVEWRFWRFPHANHHGDEINSFAAAATVAGRVGRLPASEQHRQARPPRCSVFLEKRPSQDNEADHTAPTRAKTVPPTFAHTRADDAAEADGDCCPSARHLGGAERDVASVPASGDWRTVARPNRVGRLLLDASASEGDDAGCRVVPDAVKAAAPVGDACEEHAMGNKSSSGHQAEKKAKGSSDCLASETPKGSPGLVSAGTRRCQRKSAQDAAGDTQSNRT